jgi:hypothetical protein
MEHETRRFLARYLLEEYPHLLVLWADSELSEEFRLAVNNNRSWSVGQRTMARAALAVLDGSDHGPSLIEVIGGEVDTENIVRLGRVLIALAEMRRGYGRDRIEEILLFVR